MGNGEGSAVDVVDYPVTLWSGDSSDLNLNSHCHLLFDLKYVISLNLFCSL